MEIRSYILSKPNEGEEFEYGVKLIPSRTLDKLTDSMIISREKNIIKTDIYNIGFKKRRGLKITLNKFILSMDSLKEYINFLLRFSESSNEVEKDIKSEFIIENWGKIIVSSLNKDYIKISSEKVRNSSLDKIFFTLLRTELLAYIKELENLYHGKELVNSLNYEMGYLVNPLSKMERDYLYLEALYLFIDSALDHKNKHAFEMLSKEVKLLLERIVIG